MKPSAEAMSRAGDQFLGQSYDKMDCQAFIEKCLQEVGIAVDLPGSNAWYRKMTWTGTPEECKARFGEIPKGAFLFIHEYDGGERKRGYYDGRGNASHIGIKTGRGEGAIHSSQSRGCVAESKFKDKTIRGGWNCVGLWSQLSYGDRIDALLDGSGADPAKNKTGGSGAGLKVTYTAKVIGGALNLRADQSTDSARLAQIPDGSTVTVTEEMPEWCMVEYNGKTGYVLSKYLAEIQKGADGETITVSRAQLESIYDKIGNWLRG